MLRRFTALTIVAVFVSLAHAQAPAFFIHADAVRGAQQAQGAVCVANALFYPGEWVIFRAVVTDAATGEEIGHEEIEARGITAKVIVAGVGEIEMFYPPLEAGTPPAMYFFRGPWPIPADFAMGEYGWSIEVSDAEGNVGSFAPIGQAVGLSSITVMARQ
jgi:hypothetical protein